MPDVTCCSGETKQGFICPKRDKCYRFTAKPDRIQSYFSNMPWFNQSCEYFWEDKANYVKDERNV